MKAAATTMQQQQQQQQQRRQSLQQRQGRRGTALPRLSARALLWAVLLCALLDSSSMGRRLVAAAGTPQGAPSALFPGAHAHAHASCV
jgi:hypothetical protein